MRFHSWMPAVLPVLLTTAGAADQQAAVVRLAPVYEYDPDLPGVVLAARVGYDPYARLNVLTTIDSIDPASSELTVLMKTHPPTHRETSRPAGPQDGQKTGRLRLRENQRRALSPGDRQSISF